MRLSSILERLRFSKKASKLALLPGECSRYIFSGSHFSSRGAKAAAFLPPNRPGGKTSIFLVNGLSNEERWQLGQKQVESVRDLPMKARADFQSNAVDAQGLRIDHDGEGHYRHANIVGWPEEKSERKLRAQGIAAQASLFKI